MISRKIRLITAAAALALLATVAVARTVHTHAPSAAGTRHERQSHHPARRPDRISASTTV